MTDERCWCENRNCDKCRGDGCDNPASETVVCEYIGGICDECACHMPDVYLHPRMTAATS